MRTFVGPLVEMLAAIPSVILGFWGIIVLAPFMQAHVEPALHAVLGFTGVFGAPQATGLSMFTAGVVLTVMVVPIIASLSRDLFLTVPRELTDGAEALGATRWEVIRGVVLPTTFSGVSAAVMLGLGRALGEAIAVASVIGAGNVIHGNLFNTGNTLAARVALEITYVTSNLQTAALFYLALILLAIGVFTNLVARAISTRFDVHRSVRLRQPGFDPTAPLVASGQPAPAAGGQPRRPGAGNPVGADRGGRAGARRLRRDRAGRPGPQPRLPDQGPPAQRTGRRDPLRDHRHALIVAMAAAIATPIGVLTAIYLVEFAGPALADRAERCGWPSTSCRDCRRW